MKKRILVFAFLLCLATNASAKSNFLNERYRGWLWFENKDKGEAAKGYDRGNNQSLDISPKEAKEEIERFAKELEELKFMMLARPTAENVKAYRDKEKQMWDQAEALHEAWDLANLLYPQQRDLINNPVNVHGVKAKRAMQEEENTEKLKKLAQDFELVLFFSHSCGYCKLLSPVLKNFGEQYGFNIAAVSREGSKHEYFNTANKPELIDLLGIKAFPTVIAVSHDAKVAFELIRGYVSGSELEEYGVIAFNYLQREKNKEQAATYLTTETLQQ